MNKIFEKLTCIVDEMDIMRLTLQKVQCIYFESIERHFLKFGYKLCDLLNILINQGFQILEIEGDKVWNVSSNCYPESSNNLVGVREISAFLKRTNFHFSSESKE